MKYLAEEEGYEPSPDELQEDAIRSDQDLGEELLTSQEIDELLHSQMFDDVLGG